MKMLARDTDVLAALCKASQKWGLLITIPFCMGTEEWSREVVDGIRLMVPWLSDEDYEALIIEGGAMFLCDTEAECEDLYRRTHGDDGPCELTQKMSGAVCRLGDYHVYALTCDPSGQLLNENT